MERDGHVRVLGLVNGSLHAITEPREIALTRGLVTEGENLDITVDHGEERAFVCLHGRLGIDSSPTLRDRLLAMLQGQPPKTIIVDMTVSEVGTVAQGDVPTVVAEMNATMGRAIEKLLTPAPAPAGIWKN